MERSPNRSEILRYLGHRGQELDPQTECLLDTCMHAMTKAVKPRFCYSIFSLKHEDTLFLPECNLHLPGNHIKKHLRSCSQCVLLGATLGIEADNMIRIAEAESMTKAVILDAVATQMIEELCDCAEEELRQMAEENHLYLTSRFSPGYGDLPITLQHRISEILDTPRKIGLTVTEQSLMIPRKSVTAIIGLSSNACQTTHHNCAECSLYERCQFRKENSSHES